MRTNESERRKLFAAAREVLLAALPEIWAIYTYGSFARGEEWPTSDLDLAVLLPPDRHLDDLLALTARVSERVGYRGVDLVDLGRVGLDLIVEVLRDGIVLHLSNEARTLAWEAARMTDYAEFQPRRAAILARYMREPLCASP